MAMSRSAQGYSAALAGAVFLSTTSIFIRHLVTEFDMPPLVLAFWRNVFVVSTLVPFMLLFNRKLLRVERAHIPFLAAFGLMLAGFNGFWAISVAQNGAAVATVMVYCSVAYTAILGWKFLGESLGALKFAAIVLCLCGCALISGALNASAWQSNLPGVVAGLLTGLCYTAYSLMGRVTSERGLGPGGVEADQRGQGVGLAQGDAHGRVGQGETASHWSDRYSAGSGDALYEQVPDSRLQIGEPAHNAREQLVQTGRVDVAPDAAPSQQGGKLPGVGL